MSPNFSPNVAEIPNLGTNSPKVESLTVTVLPITWQESELMFRNNGLLHHNVIIAAGILS